MFSYQHDKHTAVMLHLLWPAETCGQDTGAKICEECASYRLVLQTTKYHLPAVATENQSCPLVL
jgi:hypothetical protein